MQRENIVMLSDPQSQAAEAYRSLRVNLHYASLDDPLKTLVIALPAVEKGALKATEVSVNLAVAMAQAGQRVVLVDADLRHPQLHEIFSVSGTPGLAQAILMLEADDSALPLVETEVEGLRFLPGGDPPPNPADILSSQKMTALLQKLASQTDVTILKAPPVLLAADTPALAARTDGLLLVARSGHTRRDRLAAAKEKLEQFEVHLLGAVLTDASEDGYLSTY
jgi:capsular exopolysaccharide synthesis family protein